jgi:hypothetical protein
VVWAQAASPFQARDGEPMSSPERRIRNRERRRGWDSNPRAPCDANSFRDCPALAGGRSRKPNSEADHHQGNVLGNETRIRTQDARLPICGHQDDGQALARSAHGLPTRGRAIGIDESGAVGIGRATLDRKVNGFIHDVRCWRSLGVSAHTQECIWAKPERNVWSALEPPM